MTKKHFIAIAAAFKRRMDGDIHPLMAAQLRGVAEDLCRVFAAANPAFDRDRFMTACGF